jgi:quinohemoprotein ethanol dehydrogenase
MNSYLKGVAMTYVLLSSGAAMSLAGAAERKPAITERVLGEEADGADWPAYGRTFSEDHYSPLTQISDRNLSRLRLAWFIDLPTMISSLSAPLAVDGVLYFAVGYSVVYAADASTGKVLWTYDPQVTAATNDKLRAAWGIRGLAYSNGRLFVGTQDGRLVALSASTGKLVWSVQTTDPEDARYITGAPRVFKDKVIIGHGGADVGPVRGYVTAYDKDTGRQAWRFFVVPGDPAKGFENKAMEMAAKTWTGEWWKYGGGGTVWNAMTYDPKYNRIYLGTGNGAPWNRKVRSPGGGDNLFLSSIVALNADTGEYAWHYQTTPGESWDFNSDMDIELATLIIDGSPRDVILHAPKNGFFYVIDRADGKLISAEPYTKVTWAERIDKETGRPVEDPQARYPNGETAFLPGSGGAHTWHAMSFSPQTKLVYLPVSFLGGYYNDRGVDPKTWTPTTRPAFDTGLSMLGPDIDLPDPDDRPLGALQARDPVAQRIVWSIPSLASVDGGILSTAGNLVFQGRADGAFVARAADSGKLLWSFDAQNGISGQPITYLTHGKQFVTVIAGYGGSATLAGAASARFGWGYRTQMRRVLTFAIDGRGALPPRPKTVPEKVADDGTLVVDTAKSARGRLLFETHCLLCHGPGAIAGGSAPDLRASAIPLSGNAFTGIVQNGSLQLNGMPRFDELDAGQIEDLRDYIRREARKAIAKEPAKAVP